ncbi:cyclic-amp response element binding protein [Anaeramoeba flamelloides]|uniref:Cyclic-amp response element binding protein n=1 Tax=Anaeramoeba flamelloides TaxID=1746091 RepID=A0AAV7Z5N6_9EUKA|nr:cyclic-amp response element binding protein [Anaeramoeba flamelloides]
MDYISESTDLFDFSSYLNELSDFATLEDLETITSNEENLQAISSPLILDETYLFSSNQQKPPPLQVQVNETTTTTTTKLENSQCVEINKPLVKSKFPQNPRKRRYVVIKKIKKKREKITFPTPLDKNGNPRELTKSELRKRELERNRLNAIKSRKRKKNYVKKLEKESQTLKQRTGELSNQLQEMKQTNKFLKEQSEKLKQLVLQTFSVNTEQLNKILNNENENEIIQNENVQENEKENETQEQEQEQEQEIEQEQEQEIEQEQELELSSFEEEDNNNSGFWHRLTTIPSSFTSDEEFAGNFDSVHGETVASQDDQEKKQTFGASLLIILFTFGLLFSFSKLCINDHCIEFGSILSSSQSPSSSPFSFSLIPQLVSTSKTSFSSLFSQSIQRSGIHFEKLNEERDSLQIALNTYLDTQQHRKDAGQGLQINGYEKDGPSAETREAGGGVPGDAKAAPGLTYTRSFASLKLFAFIFALAFVHQKFDRGAHRKHVKREDWNTLGSIFNIGILGFFTNKKNPREQYSSWARPILLAN